MQVINLDHTRLNGFSGRSRFIANFFFWIIDETHEIVDESYILRNLRADSGLGRCPYFRAINLPAVGPAEPAGPTVNVFPPVFRPAVAELRFSGSLRFCGIS